MNSEVRLHSETARHRIGRAMRRARVDAGVAQNDLAAMLERSKQYLSACETGRLRPSRDLVRAYEAHLGLVPGSLERLLPPGARGDYPPVALPDGAVEQLLAVATAAEIELSTAITEQTAQTRPAAAPAFIGTEQVMGALASLFDGLDRGGGEIVIYMPKGVGSPGISSSQLVSSLAQALLNGWRVATIGSAASRSPSSLVEDVAAMISLARIGGNAYRALVSATDQEPVAGSPLMMISPYSHASARAIACTSHPTTGELLTGIALEGAETAAIAVALEATLSRSQPLIRTHAVTNGWQTDHLAATQLLEWLMSLAALSTSATERKLYAEGISAVHMPTRLWREVLSGDRSAYDIDLLTATLRDHRADAQRLAASGHSKEIVAERSLARLADSGAIACPELAVSPGSLTVPRPAAEAVDDELSTATSQDHLRVLEERGASLPYYWEVLSGNEARTVTIACPPVGTGGEDASHIFVELRSPDIANAFSSYFDSLWSEARDQPTSADTKRSGL